MYRLSRILRLVGYGSFEFSPLGIMRIVVFWSPFVVCPAIGRICPPKIEPLRGIVVVRKKVHTFHAGVWARKVQWDGVKAGQWAGLLLLLLLLSS